MLDWLRIVAYAREHKLIIYVLNVNYSISNTNMLSANCDINNADFCVEQ